MKKVLLIAAALSIALVSTSFAAHQRHTRAMRSGATTMPAMHQQPAWRNVLTAAQSNRKLTTFYAAVKAAGLAKFLKRRGPFTVFAPSNRAFAKLPKGTLQVLFQPKNRRQLRNILMYHIVKARLASASASANVRPGWYRTVQGRRIVVTNKRGREYINGYARIKRSDMMARNGVIHIINKVLMPPRG